MKKGKILALSVFFAGMFIHFEQAPAKEPMKNPPNIGTKLKNGIGNMQYYVDSSATAYSKKIATSANQWMYTGWNNPLYLYKKSNNTGSNMDVYAVSKLSEPRLIGETSYYDERDRGFTEAQIKNSKSRHFWGKILLSNAYKNDVDFDRMITHEMGHVFGMGHSDNLGSIMYADSKMKVKKPAKGDSDKLIHLYGW